ncbi:MAG TPA: restriction endonuclease subunit S [Dehalococcoidia bacterium]|nr:restriction endonuclease subunit S [Dehalococcoidia bacterium]
MTAGSKWSVAKLGPLCSKIGSGMTPRGGESVYTGDGVALIRSQNVYNAEFAMDGLAHITDEQAEKMNGVEVLKGDVLLNITGDSVARSCTMPDSVLPARVNQHVSIIRPDNQALDARFLMYYLISPYMQAYLLSLAGSGGTRKALTKSMIEEFIIPLPMIDEQKRIADIISAYDDLIESNRRRIGLLEQAACLLYREWFVHLRFPGHEHVKITDGVPEGWESKGFANVLGNHIGGGWGQEDPLGSETTPAYVIRGTDIESVISGNFEDIGLRYHKDSALQSRLLKTGDIIFEVSGGSATQLIGRSLLISKKMIDVYDGSVICASFCKRLTPLSSSLSPYLYYHIKHIRENGELNTYIKQSASALQNFNFAAFLEHYFVRIPNRLLLGQFAEQVSLFESQKFTLAIQTYNLKRARDLLLPRLMNGEIAV